MFSEVAAGKNKFPGNVWRLLKILGEIPDRLSVLFRQNMLFWTLGHNMHVNFIWQNLKMLTIKKLNGLWPLYIQIISFM